MSVIPLNQFIKINYAVELNDSNIGNNIELLNLLSNFYLCASFESKLILNLDKAEISLIELINNCKELLIKNNRSDNVLIYGYKTTEGTIDSNFYNKNTHLSLNYLNNPSWKSIKLLIGSVNLSDLFLNYSGFLKLNSSFIHLFGPTIDKNYNKFELKQSFSLNKAFYHKRYDSLKSPILNNKFELIKQIFENDYINGSNNGKVLKRHKQFLKLLIKVIKNNKDLNYSQIAFNICRENQMAQDNLQLSIEKSLIIKFCTIICDRLFPKEIFGSSHNKSQIFKLISKLILGNRSTRLDLLDCIKHIKIKEIPWLGKVYGNLNKQDFIKRENLLKNFISWIFNKFLINLLSLSFHITHISSSNEILFFHHKTWERISKPFVNKYLNDYLVENDNINSKTLTAKFRIMPKKSNDFRVINTPFRGKTKSEKFEYTNKVNSEIRPAKKILNKIRLLKSSNFSKVKSVSNVAKVLGEFKLNLLKKYDNRIPELYFIKFDVKQCFDNLPKDKIYEILTDLIKKDDCYYLKDEIHTNLKNLTSKSLNSLKTTKNLNDLLNFEINNDTDVINIGKSKINSIIGNEILDITNCQLSNSLTKIGNKFYSRRKGIFQGLHHSSLFCDIVYDNLIDCKFKFLNNAESIILRIADDFLIISINPSITAKCKEILRFGIPDYGISINDLKTVVNFSSLGDFIENVGIIKFCGFQIDTFNLDIIKEFDNSNLSYSIYKSNRKFLEKLLNIYKLRISYNTLNIRFNSFNSILTQLSIIIETISNSYCLFSKGINLTIIGFEEFFKLILIETFKKINKLTFLQKNEIKIKIINIFLKKLIKKNTKFKNHIKFLKLQLSLLI